MIFPQFFDILFHFFYPLFSLLFNLGNSHWPVFKLTDYSLSCVLSADEPMKDIFHSCYSIFDFQHSLWVFLRVSISLLTLLIWFYMLSTLFIRAIYITIIVIFISLSDNNKSVSYIWVWFWCFVFSDCVFIVF